MEYIKKIIKANILDFLYEEKSNQKIYSGSEVWEYFNKLTSLNHANYYKQQILNNKFLLKEILIEDLLKFDIDLSDFIETHYNNFIEDFYEKDVDTYGLIGDSRFDKDVLIDGYHRVLQKVTNLEKTFKVFVPLHSRFA